jgi:serine/threonine protein phosphatase PrpC
VDEEFLSRKMAEAAERTDGEMDFSGSTAICAYFTSDRFFCASLGDCRAVLCRKGAPLVVSAQEHKAARKDETASVIAAGVSCTSCGG